MRRALIVACLLITISLVRVPRLLNAQAPGDEYLESIPMRVELAWLADPSLCCYHPAARLEGDKLRVSGYVPSRELQARALQIALNVSNMVVINEIVVHAGTRIKHADVSADVLVKNAAKTLKSRFPDDSRDWRLGVKSKGRLVLTGRVDSYDQKLDVSEKLRVLPGCLCVENQLQVIGQPKQVVSSSAIGQHSPSQAAKKALLPVVVNKTVYPHVAGESSMPVHNETVNLGPRIEPIPDGHAKPRQPLAMKPPAPRPSVYAKKHHAMYRISAGPAKSPYAGSMGTPQVVVSSTDHTMRSPYVTSQSAWQIAKPAPSPYESTAPISKAAGPSPYEPKPPIMVESEKSPYQSSGKPTVGNLPSPYRMTAQPVSGGRRSPYVSSKSRVTAKKTAASSPYSARKPKTGPAGSVKSAKSMSTPSNVVTTEIPRVPPANQPSAVSAENPGTTSPKPFPAVEPSTNDFIPASQVVPPLPKFSSSPQPSTTADTPDVNTLKEAEFHEAILKAIKSKDSQLQVHLQDNTINISIYASSYQEADRFYEIITHMPELASYRIKMAVDVPE